MTFKYTQQNSFLYQKYSKTGKGSWKPLSYLNNHKEKVSFCQTIVLFVSFLEISTVYLKIHFGCKDGANKNRFCFEINMQ